MARDTVEQKQKKREWEMNEDVQFFGESLRMISPKYTHEQN